MAKQKVTKVLDKGIKIERDFLIDLDQYFKKNYMTLKCNDIFQLYLDFWNELKKYRGNSHGFTGLSELLIFRAIYYELGGSFRRNPLKPLRNRKSDRDILWEYVSTDSKNIRIGQSIPVYDEYKRIQDLEDGKKRINPNRYPDVVIYENKELRNILQIKIYLPNGVDTIKNEMAGMESLRRTYTNFDACIILYHRLSQKSAAFKELESLSQNNKWFKFIMLEGNDNLFIDELNM